MPRAARRPAFPLNDHLPATPLPPVIPDAGGPRKISNRRLFLAFAVAGIADGFFKWAGELIPPLEWGVDLLTAGLLFLMLGWRWVLLPGLIIEAIPGLSVFPYWVLVVSVIAVQNRRGSDRR